jgi:hypothetical protein
MDDSSQEWVKAQLLREMAQVKAPDSLWPRIQAEQRARRALPRTGWILWPAVATVMLVASGDLLWQSVNAASERGARPVVLRVKTPQLLTATVSCGTCHVEPGLY